MRKTLALAAAGATLLTGLVLTTLPTLAASKSTARASGDIPVRSGPGTRYAIIGKLKNGTKVHLEQCTRESNWCLFVDADGDEVGWVRGSSIVGSAAKLQVTPHEFLGFDVLDPLNNGRWPHIRHGDDD
jgi:uncharacterized protein YraI